MLKFFSFFLNLLFSQRFEPFQFNLDVTKFVHYTETYRVTVQSLPAGMFQPEDRDEPMANKDSLVFTTMTDPRKDLILVSNLQICILWSIVTI